MRCVVWRGEKRKTTHTHIYIYILYTSTHSQISQHTHRERERKREENEIFEDIGQEIMIDSQERKTTTEEEDIARDVLCKRGYGR